MDSVIIAFTITDEYVYGERTCRETYALTCKKLGVVPMSSVLSGLDGVDIRLASRGLTDREVLALCHALLVRILHSLYGYEVPTHYVCLNPQA